MSLSRASSLWLQRLKNTRSYYHKQVGLEVEKFQVRTRVQLSEVSASESKICIGDTRLKRLYHTLDNLGIIRSEDQITFHGAFTANCLPKIYGTEWNKHGSRVMKEHHLVQIEIATLILTPRRWYYIRIIIITVIVNQPN